MFASNNAAFALALLVVSLTTRAIFDKLLALSPDWTLVAHWAQAQSLYDLTAAVSLAGIGQGLTVFAARRGESESRLMRDGLMWGFIVSGVAAVALLAVAPTLNAVVGREVAPPGEAGSLAIFAGLLATAPGLFGCYWQGRLQRGRMILLGLAGWAPLALGGSGLFGAPDMKRLLWIQIATQSALTLVLAAPLLREKLAGAAPSWRNSPLRRYVLAGVSIGLMSPASTLWARAELAHQLSWDQVAQLQALWRTSEWVNGIAGGLLVLVFLPRMAAATSRATFHAQLAHTWRMLCLPAALVYACLWAAQGAVIPFLYSGRFLMPAVASALFLAGDVLRLASWVPLHGLFATERTNVVAIGEFLSQPLFALLLTLMPQPSLAIAGACYAFTYVVYFAFNAWCVFRVQGRYAPAAA